MTDEWVERRVADLEVGDDVRDYGVVTGAEVRANYVFVNVFFNTRAAQYWPVHARVDICRPAEVTVETVGSHAVGYIYVGGNYVGHLPLAHAEEYAARLRSSAHDRAAALGKDTP